MPSAKDVWTSIAYQLIEQKQHQRGDTQCLQAVVVKRMFSIEKIDGETMSRGCNSYDFDIEEVVLQMHKILVGCK